MAPEEELKIFNEIMNKGCCKRCALRYIGQCKTLISFDYPNTSLVNFGFMSPMDEFIEEPPSKLSKSNPCNVCLGVLQDSIIEEMLTHENLTSISEYSSESFVAYITFPTCVLVRDHSMKIYLKRMFPDSFNANKVIKINHAWRYTIEERLSRILNKSYNHQARLTLHFYTGYLLEEEEMEVVQSVLATEIKQNSLSRHCVTSLLDAMPPEDFAKLVNVPPKVPLYAVTLKDLKYFSEAIHLMGKYCKYSRELLQVPQFVNNEVVNENSIQTIILKAIKSVASFKDLVFKASSFDDQSIRVLGKGRTFHLQINDPKVEKISRAECREIEKIIKRSKVLLVTNLKQADKRDITVAMDSEQLSPRLFKVLCNVYKCKNIDYCVNAVNMYRTLNVEQSTPIRALSQRPYWSKTKKIYYIKATKITGRVPGDNLIELDLCAQSGLYVHEFVHGDFGRTTPSLGDIMKAKVEVLALDVLDFQATLPCAAEEEEVVI